MLNNSNIVSLPKNLIINHLLSALPNIIALYVFGSRITNHAQSDSDLDCAILVAGYVKPLKLWELAGDLAEQLNYDVDLLDLRAASTVMQYQIITTGQLLYGKQSEAALYECFILSEKMTLNTAREQLLITIGKEGRIYG